MGFNSDKQTKEEYRANRVASKGKLYDQLCDLFFKYDPVGINLVDNIDEYEPEVETILPRLGNKPEPDYNGVIVNLGWIILIVAIYSFFRKRKFFLSLNV